MKPLSIQLLSMPFAPLDCPSLGLTQLRGELQRRFGDRVRVDIHYAGFDFLRHVSGPALESRVWSSTGFLTHLGDWFFAQAAFPEAGLDAEGYLDRYYHGEEPEHREVRALVSAWRPALPAFLDQLIDRLGLLQAEVVGFTSMFQQNTASFALARRIKERRSAVVTVMGGSACEGIPGREMARLVPALDFVFSGPALRSFPAFIGCLLEGNTEELHRISGVFSRRNAGLGSSQTAPPVPLLGEEADIDDPVPLDYDGFLAAYAEAAGPGAPPPFLLFETSRGCWWGDKSVCSFCGLNGARPRHQAMAPATAIRYLQSLYPYARRARCFVASDNILPRDYAAQVFARLRPPPGFGMKYETRVDLDLTALKQLQSARVVALQPGIESFSTATLRLMRKGTTALQNLRFLKDCARIAMVVEWNLLLGSPGESKEVWEKLLRDLPLLHHLPPPQAAFPVMFVRFSPYFEEAQVRGLALKPHDFYAQIYPGDAASRERLAHFFVRQAPGAGEVDDWLGPVNEAIRGWKERWSQAARLHWEGQGGSARIVDTRQGERRSYELRETSRRLLGLLENPRSRTRLERELADTGWDVAEELEWLRERGLLFEEDDSYLSLVCGET